MGRGSRTGLGGGSTQPASGTRRSGKVSREERAGLGCSSGSKGRGRVTVLPWQHQAEQTPAGPVCPADPQCHPRGAQGYFPCAVSISGCLSLWLFLRSSVHLPGDESGPHSPGRWRDFWKHRSERSPDSEASLRDARGPCVFRTRYLRDAMVIKRPLQCKIKKHTGASPKVGSPTSTKFNSFKGCLPSRCTSQLPGHEPHSG